MKRTYILFLLISATLLFSGCAARQKQHSDSNQSNQSSPAASSESDTRTSNLADSSSPVIGGEDNASQIISADEAESIALSHAGYTKEQVTIAQNKLDYDDGRQIYEIEFYTDDSKEYDYEIDALTKDILSFDQDAEYYAPSAAPAEENSISEEDAKNLALSRVPGATVNDIRKFEIDYDHGHTEYEGKIFYNGIEYEFEIDAKDGSFLSWKEEYDD